ncbi:MAG: hypothetical protein P4L98_09065 [Ancalomicrobiaceae bacterium]|nr:hypothetical protein [Ancalomicrobiaceae bacterium]
MTEQAKTRRKDTYSKPKIADGPKLGAITASINTSGTPNKG